MPEFFVALGIVLVVLVALHFAHNATLTNLENRLTGLLHQQHASVVDKVLAIPTETPPAQPPIIVAVPHPENKLDPGAPIAGQGGATGSKGIVVDGVSFGATGNNKSVEEARRAFDSICGLDSDGVPNSNRLGDTSAWGIADWDNATRFLGKIAARDPLALQQAADSPRPLYQQLAKAYGP